MLVTENTVRLGAELGHVQQEFVSGSQKLPLYLAPQVAFPDAIAGAALEPCATAGEFGVVKIAKVKAIEIAAALATRAVPLCLYIRTIEIREIGNFSIVFS